MASSPFWDQLTGFTNDVGFASARMAGPADTVAGVGSLHVEVKVDDLRFRAVRLTPYSPDGEAVGHGIRTWPWLGVACRDESGTRLWMETDESVGGAVRLLASPPAGGWHDVALWADVPDGGLGEVVVRQVETLQIRAVGLGYVTLHGSTGSDLLRTRVAAPPAGVELGVSDRPGAWSAVTLGRQIADECRFTEEARQRRRATVDATRRERRTARQTARPKDTTAKMAAPLAAFLDPETSPR